MKHATWILGLALLALPAQADWQKNCDSSRAAVTGIQAGEFVCHDVTAADVDPPILSVNACENWDALWYPDPDGSGTDSTSTVAIYTCPDTDANITTNTAGCQPLDGGTTLGATNTEVFGAASVWMWADVSAFNDGGRIIVRCAQPSSR